MRRYLLILLAVCCLSTVSSGQPAPPAPPKLILVVSVDQMRFDFLERFAPLYRVGPQDAARARRRVQQREVSSRGNGDRTWALRSADRLRSKTLWHRRQRLVGPVSQARRQRRRRSCADADRRVRPCRLAGKPADVHGRRRAEKQEPPLACRRRRRSKIVRPF